MQTGVKSQVTSKINENSSELIHSVETAITTGADIDASAYTLSVLPLNHLYSNNVEFTYQWKLIQGYPEP